MKKIIVVLLFLLSFGMCYAQAKKAKDPVPKTDIAPPPVKTPPTSPKDVPMEKAISISSGGGGVSIRPPQEKRLASPKPQKDSMKLDSFKKN
jgi:hypothetical protein